MKTLNIIGCGKVGKTLGYLWAKQQCFLIQDILNNHYQSALEAVDFMGCGRAVENSRQLMPADVYMLAVPDSHINECVNQLTSLDIIKKGDIVFHCSGVISSHALSVLRVNHAFVASMHPVKSFIDPKLAIKTFANVYCGMEGDEEACFILKKALDKIDVKSFNISASHKPIYHASLVIACNYLVSLMEIALLALESCDINRTQALGILQPLVTNTLSNIFNAGTTSALSGPIHRGDYQVVAQEWEALNGWDTDIAEIYRLLGKVALKLSLEKNELNDSYQKLMNMLALGNFQQE